MTILKHEMRQGRNTLLIWTAAIGFLLAVCIFLFPEMESEMDEVSDAFSSMGSFSQAFGMDQVSFGTLLGFYSIEELCLQLFVLFPCFPKRKKTIPANFFLLTR